MKVTRYWFGWAEAEFDVGPQAVAQAALGRAGRLLQAFELPRQP